MISAASREDTPPGSARWMLAAVLLMTAVIVLAWGHVKLLDQDEVFVLQTDSVPGVRALIRVQRHYPISLDPMVYHLLSHACVRLFGATAFAIRLPSLAGYLLMEVCLFQVGSALAGQRSGVIAAALPALAATLYYGVEARPYGVLLGLAGLILLSWLRATGGNMRRAGWLMTLAVSLGLALNTHYFAVLLLLPLCGAELIRTIRLRQVDWPVVAAIAAGVSSILFALPFQHAAGEFRLHYYNAGSVGLHAVTQAYRALVINYTDYSIPVQHVTMAALVLLTIVLLVALWLQRRTVWSAMSAGVETYVVLLAGLPFAGFLLARFATHSIEVRYVLPAIVSLSLLVAIALGPQRWAVSGWYAAMTGLLLAITIAGAERVREEQGKSSARLASLAVPAELRAKLLATPDARLYVQNLGDFEEDVPYIPDPAVQGRMTLLYSPDEEVRRLRHDTAALTAIHLQHFTHVPVVRYEDLRQQPGEHLLLIRYGGGWNWIGPALAEDHAHVEWSAPAFGGEVAAVRFHEVQP